MNVICRENQRIIVVGTGEIFPIILLLKVMTVSSGEKKIYLDLLVVEGEPLGDHVENKSNEDMKSGLDLGSRQAHLTANGNKVSETINQ